MSRPTSTLLGAKARKAIYEGVNAIYNPVKITLGPEGKNVLLYRTWNRGSRITNDGHTVAQCQEPKDVHVRSAAVTFREACQRTNEKAGDGTTTTTIIGGKLFNDLYAVLSERDSEFVAKTGKIGVMSLRRQLLESAGKVKEAILKNAKKVKTLRDLEKLAIISCEDEEMGKVVAEMAWKVGLDGFIDVVEGYKGKIETEVIEGFRFPAKIPHKTFVNRPERYEMVAEDCPVLVTNYKIDNALELAGLKEINAKATSKLIIVANGFSDNVLQNIVSAIKNGFFIFPVNAPSLRTEQFEDLAIYCGATFIDKGKGKRLKNIRVEDLGFLEKLIVKDTEIKEDAVATGGAGTRTVKQKAEEAGFKPSEQEEFALSPIQERIEMLKGQLVETKQETFKKLLQRRIASMASAVGIIRVGDTTQASSLYRKLKIEDAVYACKAALRGGYVKGGGLCLKEIADKMIDDPLKAALLAPYEQIISSVDKIGDDVIDAAEAVYYAVEHAVSVVANLITVEASTQEIEDGNPLDGQFAIARQLLEANIIERRKQGMLKENEEEAFRDAMGGLTDDEHLALDPDKT